MALHDEWAKIVSSSLDWEQAHANFDHSLKGLPAEARGRRPDKFPHSVWELVFHVRAAQHDLLDFSRNAAYKGVRRTAKRAQTKERLLIESTRVISAPHRALGFTLRLGTVDA